jgi:hypothetical protein
MSAEDYVVKNTDQQALQACRCNTDLQWYLQTEDVATPLTFTLLKDAIAGLLLQEYWL